MIDAFFLAFVSTAANSSASSLSNSSEALL